MRQHGDRLLPFALSGLGGARDPADPPRLRPADLRAAGPAAAAHPARPSALPARRARAEHRCLGRDRPREPVNEDPLALAITLAIAVYSVGAHTAGRRALAGAALVATLALAGTIADANEGTLVDFLGNAIFFFTIFGGLWLAGRAIRRRRARERELIVEARRGRRAPRWRRSGRGSRGSCTTSSPTGSA